MQKADDFSKDGNISAWNEGNFKCLRLHEAQEMINQGKVNPFSLDDDGTTWNYQIWLAGIDILFGEGNSKYSTEEIDECNYIKDIINKFNDLFPPFKRITEHGLVGTSSNFVPIKKNQEKLKKFLELFEKVVKRYNDEHGLSTRNVEEEDIRGL